MGLKSFFKDKAKTRTDSLVLIKPQSGLFSINFQELWAYRELFWFLALRDILVKYKQAAIGVVWAVIQPVLTMIVFSVIFGGLAKLPSDGVPYPIMVYVGLLPWQFFANSMRASSQSVVGKSTILTKIYFPRLIIPTSAVISGFIDFLVSFVILFVMMIWFRIPPTFNLLFLPLFILLAFTAALGVGLWLSALNVEFRDVIYVVPFLIQAGQYVSPVAYSSAIIPEKWSFLYSLNPMVGVINGFRWAILGTATPDPKNLIISTSCVLLLFLGGLFYFKKVEKTFADII
ncbi:MAG: ABC transporter permease [Candidatus Saganbacteria bacterium]|nr:ABC transporter permease [Candidatus Saganbacteria bacterium]